MAAGDVIAGVSLLLSATLAFFYVRDRAHARYDISNEYIRELLEWHNRVIDVLMRFCHLQRAKDSSDFQHDLACLSSLIEQGRFYFPNLAQNSYGSNKPAAYRGYRNLALDFLVEFYRIVNHSSGRDESDHDLLVALQRYFTSIVFQIVRPKERLNTIKRLTDQYFVKDHSAEDIIENPDLFPNVRGSA
ncbi:MAG: hypothetical protein ACU4EQ_10205 [Candidatus Nitrosoglobus sp.]|jgi:hypothetical protein